MKNLLFIFIFLTFVLGLPVSAKNANPIDVAEQNCLNSAKTTIDSNICEENAYKAWDAELNKNYNMLVNKLSQKQKQELLKSQLEWLKYRDLDFVFMNDVIGSQDGTIWSQILMSKRNEVVKQRALALKSYYEIVTGTYLAQ